MAWLQLRITTPRDHVPRIERVLNHAGALSITLEDNADQPIFEPELGETPLWFETRITGLFPADIDSNNLLKDVVNRAKIASDQAHWHVLEDKDWEREWMQHYAPIQCGERFWICPSWLNAPDPEAVNLVLDPGLAFGTGTHPTTFLCLQWLATQKLDLRTVLDYGCGSGILAQGIDIDPQALIASKENARRNALDEQSFPVFFPSKYPKAEHDFVLANILAGPLVELAEELIVLLTPGGKLCLSGILETQVDTIISAYEHKIDFAPPTVKESWACITGQKRVS